MALPDDWERVAFENLSGDESLTDELTDDLAVRLLDWSLRQVLPMARLADDELQVGDVLGRVRRIARAVNRLVGRLDVLDPDAVAFRLRRLAGYYALFLDDEELDALRERLRGWAESAADMRPGEALNGLLTALDLSGRPTMESRGEDERG